MKKSLRFVSLSMAFVMSLILLAGCGNKESGKTAASTAKNNETATTAAPKKGPVSLVFYHWGSGTLQKQLDEFQKKNDGTKVELVLTPNNEYTDKLKIALAGGEKIDVYANTNGANYVDFAAKFKAVPLDDYVAKDKWDLTPFGSTINYSKIDGKLLGLPTAKNGWLLYYNKKLFDDAKVPYPKDDMTWNEYAELAKKMTKGDGANKIWGSFMQDWAQVWAIPQIQKGKTIFDDDLSLAKEGLALHIKMQNVDKSEMPWADVKTGKVHHRDAFAKGNVAMMVIGDWMLNILNGFKKDGKIAFDYDIANPPHPEGVPAGTTIGGPSTFLCINGTSQHKEDAWKLIKFITGEEGSLIYAADKQSPAYVNDKILNAFVGDTPQPANLKIFLKLNAIPQFPFKVGASDVDKIMTEEGELAFVGEQNADKAMEKIIKRRAEALAKYK